MKKLQYTILTGAFLKSGCNPASVGVKLVDGCCHKLSFSPGKLNQSWAYGDDKKKDGEKIIGVAILSSNSWDGKMLIW